MAWLNGAIEGLNQEVLMLEAQITALEAEKAKTAAQQSLASQQSLGLSPNLKVDKITDTQPELTSLRPTGLLGLTGASLGLILWAILWLASISLRAKR